MIHNGPELTAEVFFEWYRDREIEIGYIHPGKPDRNAYIERFNRGYRPRRPGCPRVGSLDEVRAVTEEWIDEDYTTQRSRDSLGRVPPLTFLPKSTSTRECSFMRRA